MPPENIRDRKEKGRLTFIVVPSGESKQTRTFSVSIWGIVTTVLALFFVTIALVVASFIYTPARKLLPTPSSELERRYGSQIAGIQDQVSRMAREMGVLRAYNLRLRKALGEEVSPQDSMKEILPGPLALDDANTARLTGAAERPNVNSVSAPPPSVPVVAVSAAPSTVADVPLATPAEGYRTRGFEPRRNHFGIDIAGKVSSGILAAADGTVLFSGWTYDDGFMMMIAHDGGLTTVYKHNSALLKSTGAAVRKGELIALLGNTGRTSSGPHLHFEVWKNGIAIDPEQLLLTTR